MLHYTWVFYLRPSQLRQVLHMDILKTIQHVAEVRNINQYISTLHFQNEDNAWNALMFSTMPDLKLSF
jgi:hypothetical protein